ncbi:MAG: alpha/beta fold hydrolase [Acidimicrobiales bacterium]|nr:alpha/beta fold hydrolase [Acidimicrobiales bacterium]
MSPRREVSAADGSRISYEVAGVGPYLLIVPALLQSAALWREMGYVDRLATDHRVIVMDPLGHGESDRPHDPAVYGVEQAVGHVIAVLENEGIERATLWGFGAGAETVVDTARRRPDVVDAVVIGGTFLGDFAEGMREIGGDLTELTDKCASALEAGDWDAYFALMQDPVPLDVRRDRADANDPAAIAAVLRSDLRRARGFLKPSVPTFAYWAEDAFIHPHNRELVERLPIEWMVVPGLVSDAPELVDAVVTRVRRFLESAVRS